MGFVTRLFFVSSEPRFGRGRSIGSLPQWTLQRSLDIDERTVLAAMAALQLLAPRLALHLRVPPDDGGPLVEVLDVDRAASALSALLPPEHLTESRVALAAGWLGAKGATPLGFEVHFLDPAELREVAATSSALLDRLNHPVVRQAASQGSTLENTAALLRALSGAKPDDVLIGWTDTGADPASASAPTGNVSFEGVDLGSGVSLRDAVRDVLAGTKVGAGRDDRVPADWLVRAAGAASPDGRAALGWAVSELLRDSEVRVRAGAITFFVYCQQIDDRGRLGAALVSDDGAYRDVMDPFDRHSELRVELARAVAADRARIGGLSVLDELRAEALRPGAAGGVVAGMLAFDQDWLEERVGDIVEGTPAVFLPFILQSVMSGADPLPIVVACKDRAPTEHLRRELNKLWPREPEKRARLLAALDH